MRVARRPPDRCGASAYTITSVSGTGSKPWQADRPNRTRVPSANTSVPTSSVTSNNAIRALHGTVGLTSTKYHGFVTHRSRRPALIDRVGRLHKESLEVCATQYGKLVAGRVQVEEWFRHGSELRLVLVVDPTVRAPRRS